MDNPKISVIIPVYNAEKDLHRCVDSILFQTFSDFELLLIDDGSPDKSGIICDEYAAKDTRVKVFHKENGGVGTARQLGVEMAQGEYSIQVDSDDWCERTMLEDMYMEAIQKQADIVIASGYYADKEQCSQHIRQYYPKASPKELICLLLTRKLMVGLYTKLIRHELYANDKCFFKGVDFGEDCYAICRLLLYSPKCVFIDKAFYHYCFNSNSITKHCTRKQFEARFWWIKKLEEAFHGSPGLLNALTCMKVFVKQDAYRSMLFSQKEFDAVYPEVITGTNSIPLRFHDKCLFYLAYNGYARIAGSIWNCIVYQGVINLCRDIKKRVNR